jgi:hypothetical protein
MLIAEDLVAKRTSKRTPATVKGRAGRTGQRRAKSPRPPAAKNVPSKGAVPPAVASDIRESWPAQRRAATTAARSQHGTMVDERALARATSGQRWAARKTR